MSYAVLGTTEFDLITYWNALDLEQGMDFAEHALIGRKPRLQFVGGKLDTVKVQMRFHDNFCTPETEMAKLQQAMKDKKALKLVMGNGSYKGSFVIDSLGITHKVTTKTGTVLHSEVSVSLKESVETKPEDAKKAAAQDKAKHATKAAPKTDKKIKTSGKTRNDPAWTITPMGVHPA